MAFLVDEMYLGEDSETKQQISELQSILSDLQTIEHLIERRGRANRNAHILERLFIHKMNLYLAIYVFVMFGLLFFMFFQGLSLYLYLIAFGLIGIILVLIILFNTVFKERISTLMVGYEKMFRRHDYLDVLALTETIQRQVDAAFEDERFIKRISVIPMRFRESEYISTLLVYMRNLQAFSIEHAVKILITDVDRSGVYYDKSLSFFDEEMKNTQRRRQRNSKIIY
ncbi:hypothetical protein EQG49_06340 [Periweissella cryptocerci]|uniref:Uncharacterized protein n=1 Tax=Periweissella cryptocerci TaxID=2506420 RepID=A0A4P6YTS6_9LACO|nr:hypothetical protein [Periweissella cryptocerci]QBO36101.1 hypothetical protein EQG49_06340 [Periweissella cryptocerci]